MRATRLCLVLCCVAAAVFGCTQPNPQQQQQAAEIKTSDQRHSDEWHRKLCHAATVRVRVGNSMGTGTFYRETAQHLYVLTNAHVTGQRLGTKASIELWRNGYQSVPIDGEIVAVSFIPNGNRDISVVRIRRDSLGNYDPPSIPILDEGFQADYRELFSVGCAAGRWPTAWNGHGIDSDGRVLKFVPMPALGRSGSAIFAFGQHGPYIVGLLTWRNSGGKNVDEYDARGEETGYGMAQTHHEIWAAFRGDKPESGLADVRSEYDDKRQLCQHRLGPQQQQPATQARLQPTPAKPKPQPEQRDTVAADDDRVPDTGQAPYITLRFSDQIAIGPEREPAQIWTDCPGGQCPVPGQPQAQNGRGLFPSLGTPQEPPLQPIPMDQPTPAAPDKFNWAEWTPWIIAGLLAAAYFVRAVKVGSGKILEALAGALQTAAQNPDGAKKN